MSTDHITQRLQSLRMWKREGKRAPHKPLLLLYAIARCLRGEERLGPFTPVQKDLKALLRRFGRPTRTLHPEWPFWHLQGDGVWEVEGADKVRLSTSRSPYVSSLKQPGVRAGLLERDYETLRDDPALAMRVAESLLHAHFPAETWHEDILEATGISAALAERGDFWSEERSLQEVTAYSEMEIVERRRRNHAFKSIVLKAYDEQCAVCEFGVRIDESPLAIEAAHVKWHSAEGPDEVSNGLALCSLHHSLFDRGAFTVRPDLRVTVASRVEGARVEEALGQFDGETLRAPPPGTDNQPSPEFLNWHASEVFRGEIPTRIQA